MSEDHDAARPAPERVLLPRGHEVEIRPIEPSDAEALELGLAAASAESAYRRFLSPKRSLGREELRYLTTIDHHSHEALIAVEPGTERGLGVVRFVRDPASPTLAEVAFIVADDWQGRGLGTALLERLAVRAVHEGVAEFTALTLEENARALAVLRKLGPVALRHAGGGTAELRVPLPTVEAPG